MPPYHHTWNFMILPFLEQQPLYDTIDLNRPIWGQGVVGTPVATLRCPSDANFRDISESGGIAITNYPGSEGYYWHAPPAAAGRFAGARYASPKLGDPFTKEFSPVGVFTQTRTHSISNITDGTSNTIIVAEKDSVGFYGGANESCGTGARRMAPRDAVFCSAFVGTGYCGFGGNEMGQNTFDPDGSSNSAVTWFVPPGAPSYLKPFPPTYIAAWGPNAEYPSPSSYHPGGVQVGYVDGSVSFLSETIDYGTWLKLNLIADGHTMQDPR